MKPIAKWLVLMLSGMVVLSGCSTISSMLMSGKDHKVADVATTDEATTVAEPVIQFTFYESFANW